MLDHGDIKLLEVFLAVVDHGSMSSAADVLHRSTPSVSEAISRLELKLGFEVLYRSARGCHPTPAGRDLSESVRQLLGQVDSSLASIAELAGQSKSLRIGSVYGIFNDLANGLELEGFEAEGASMSINNPGRSILDGEVDLGILLGPTSQDTQLERRHLFYEPRIAVMKVHNVPDGATSVTLDELDELVWPAIPAGADETYLGPWLSYDERGGPPRRQELVPTDPFAMLDWMQRAPDAVIPTTLDLAVMFLSVRGYVMLPIDDVPGWNVDLVTRSDSNLPVGDLAQSLVDLHKNRSINGGGQDATR